MDARTGEDPAQDRGAGAGLDPQRFGQGAGGAHHLIVEERGVQPLAADLGGLLQDPVVGGVPGERGPGARLTGALHGGGADRRLLQTNRDFGERLPRQPACGRAGPRPGERGERGVGGGVEAGVWRLASGSRTAAASRPVRYDVRARRRAAR